jgi:cytidyltransferase-like protein
MVSKKRHFAKALTWRFLGTTDTIVLASLLTGSFSLGATIGILETLTKTILYYLHERAWYRLDFGLFSRSPGDDLKKRAMFIGRWQPLHNGHRWLIEQKLNQSIPVLIAVRDIPPDEKNPFTTQQTVDMINKVYARADVQVISISDIESVNYGRGVGYEINEHVPPAGIGFISATAIRDAIKEEDDSWKENVHSAIQDDVITYLQ